jgi:hypothetical protein
VNAHVRPLWVAIAVTAMAAIVAIVLSSITLSERQSTSSTTSRMPASGAYLNGSSDRPHFDLVLSELGGGRLRGAVDFSYQDGQTSLVFTFQGTSQALRTGATTGFLTLTPLRVPSDTSSELLSPPPSAISATYGAGQVNLGECDTYLVVTTLSNCRFSLSNTSAP